MKNFTITWTPKGTDIVNAVSKETLKETLNFLKELKEEEGDETECTVNSIKTESISGMEWALHLVRSRWIK